MYEPESYWSTVAKRIKVRDDGKNVIAGDDEPFYRYKREKFINLLTSVNFEDKSVLEIGSGPGGNLVQILSSKPKRLVGADISSDMIELARQKVAVEVELVKVNGTQLPFRDKEFDIVFTATVLQHNTDEAMLLALISEICRVANSNVYLFEKIESSIKGDELCMGRPIAYYSKIMENHGFQLVSHTPINLRVSYLVSGAIRKLFNPRSRVEGEPLSKFSLFLQKIKLPVTKIMDNFIKSPYDVNKLEFVRVE